ncbi:MAG: hypothetical protein WD889_00885 [Candidatus Colwellbacteria bacterium]
MAKLIKTILKLQIEAGKANPSPSALRASLKPLGLSNSATGNSRFPTPSQEQD